MIDIAYINEKYQKIERLSKSIFATTYDLKSLREYKEKILYIYFKETYDYYFSHRFYAQYEKLSIQQTIEKILADIQKTYGSLETYTALRKVKVFDNWHSMRDHKTSTRTIILTCRYSQRIDVFINLFNYIFTAAIKTEDNDYFTVKSFTETVNISFKDLETKQTFTTFVNDRLKLVRYKDVTEEV